MQVYKAIKYIRLSYTDDKTVESDSVANQRRLIDDYIARHPEIEVVAEKIDDGYSGVLFDRPAFQEMMRMIEQGEANCVIVKDLSRLGREYIETGRYMRRVFPAYRVRFIAINDNVDTENDAADDLTVSVKNIMNEAYCRDISVKTRSALEVKRRSGDFVGAFTIYGYVKVGDKHKSLEKQYVKTMFHAAYKREVFEKVGFFSENLLRTEDNEMHYRIREVGFKLCYDPRIVSYQYARSSFSKMLKQKYANGYWIGLTLKICPKCISLYHLIPFLFVSAVVFSSILAFLGVPQFSLLLWVLYGLFAVVNTVISAVHNGFHIFTLCMPFLFLVLHAAYGVGTLMGLLRKVDF